MPEAPAAEKPWWHPIKEPGSAAQIVIAAALAITIGLIVTATVDEVPVAAVAILGIPGVIWLRGLQAIVAPLIMTALIQAIQRLKAMSGAGTRIAKWTIGYYISLTVVAIVHSIIAVSLGWSRLMTNVPGAADTTNTTTTADATGSGGSSGEAREEVAPHDVIVDLFKQLVPNNLLAPALDNGLLSLMVIAIVLGALLKPGGPIMKVVVEVEALVARVVAFLIKCAPIGVFFLILPNLFSLDIRHIGQNLGVLIGATLVTSAFHLFIILPTVFWWFTRSNPYKYLLRISPAWMTAWGTASSAATLPVTMRVTLEQGIPDIVAKFVVSIGCVVNMDGSALYFPIAVTFMAVTQGISLNAGEYVIIVLLSTLATIGTSPIPNAGLVFIIMICEAVNIPVGPMYAVIVAIEWFLDRFATAINVIGDSFAAKVIATITGVTDEMMEEVRCISPDLGIERTQTAELDAGRPNDERV
ncbi:unnamed protein product [Discula destructiva]